MFHCLYINLVYYVIDYHVRVKTPTSYVIYCCFCISDTLYFRYSLSGSGRHRSQDYHCQTVFEYKYNIKQSLNINIISLCQLQTGEQRLLLLLLTYNLFLSGKLLLYRVLFLLPYKIEIIFHCS